MLMKIREHAVIESLAASRKIGWLLAVLAAVGCNAGGGVTDANDGSAALPEAAAPEAAAPDSSSAPAEAGAPDDAMPEGLDAAWWDAAFASSDASVGQGDSAAPTGPAGDATAGDECVNDPNCPVAGTNCGPDNAVVTCVAGANGCLTAASTSLCGSHFVCVGAPGNVVCDATP